MQFKLTAAVSAIFLVSICSSAQITNVTDDTIAPIPGSGHDYIKMLSETVNPANGSLNVQIELPVAPGRRLTLPFSLAYNSNTVHHLIPSPDAHQGMAEWISNKQYLSQGGWGYALPILTASEWDVTAGSWPNFYTCNVYSEYVFMDSSGGPHALGLGSSSSGRGICRGVGERQSGDAQVVGLLLDTQTDNYNPTSYPPMPVTVTTHDGTVYNFSTVLNGGGTPAFSLLPTKVEDRNGNVINVTDNQNGNFSVTDTAGRTAISSSGFGPSGATNTITLSGLTYQVTWRTVSASFSVQSSRVGSTFDSCSPVPAVNDTQTAISQLILPNGLSYTFYYGDNPDPTYQNPYGLLSEIDYPSGASVKYTWKLSDTLSELAVYPGGINDPPQPDPDGCLYQYQTPVIASRVVTTGGSVVVSQTFTYSTTWGSDQTSWTQKTTNVNSTDHIFNNNTVLTKYTYQPVSAPSVPFVYTSYPGQIAVESAIQYYDWGNTSSPLRTVNKGWSNPFVEGCETTATETGLTAATWYVYDSNYQVTHKKEYDYGVVGNGPCSPSTPPSATPSRETIVTYHSFISPPNGGLIQGKPDSIQVYGTGTLAAETDYLYDASGIASGHSPTQHDANYSTGQAALRGNATTVTRKCLQSCSDSVIHYVYDETGQAVSKTDTAGNSTSYSYTDNPSGGNPSGNSDAYLTQVTYPLVNGIQQQMSFAYSYMSGDLTTVQDQNGKQTGYIYADSMRRPTEVDYADGGKVTYNYHADALPLTVSQTSLATPDPSITRTTVYDGMGHVTATSTDTDPDGAVTTEYTYDGLGRLYTNKNPHRSSISSTDGLTQYQYDGIGRLTRVTRPDGNFTTTTYAANCSTTTDEATRPRKSCFDGLGRLISVTEPNASTGSLSSGSYLTTYGYNPMDDLTNVNQQGDRSLPARTRTFNYDSLSRLTFVTSPESNTVIYTFGSAADCPTPNSFPDDLVKRVDARGVRTCYQYDALHRLTQKNYSGSTTPTVTYYYEQSLFNGLNITNGNGRRTGMSDGTGATAWSYDAVGNILFKRQTINGITNTIAHTYNLNHGADTITSPNNHVYSYAYNGSGEPISLNDTGSGITYAQNAHYAPPGELSSAAHGLGLVITESNIYSNRLQPTQISVGAPSGTLLSLQYNWAFPGGANNGSVYQIQNNRDTTRNVQFTYDYLNRLSTAGTYSASTWGDAYVYDAFGNLLQENVTQGTADHLQVTVDANNHINTGGWAYDAAGNMTWEASKSNALKYDAENRLNPVAGYVYSYDGDDHRVEKNNGGSITYYWYDEDANVISTTGALTRDYVYFNGRRLAYYAPSSGNQHYYWSDHLGSASVMSNSNGSSIEWEAYYYPFGTPNVLNNFLDNYFRFSDYEWDPEMGYNYDSAREQSPSIGRFLSPDEPLTDQDERDPQSWNLYSYVRNNPANRTDPTGRACVSNGSGSWKDDNRGGETCAQVEEAERHRQASVVVTASYTQDERIQLLANDITNYTSISSLSEVGRRGIEGAQAAEGLWNLPSFLRNVYYWATGETLVIGKLGAELNVKAIEEGDTTLVWELGDQGSPKANWAQNASKLRKSMRLGRPIKDVSVDESGNMLHNTGFLRAERQLLDSHGWKLSNGYWNPPAR